MENNPYKLALLTRFLKVSESKGFKSYLEEVWIDLISRITNNDKINNNINQDKLGITKLLFTKYYSLPGIIGDRLFRVFDSNNHGVLDYNDFKTGMLNLFCESYEKTLRFIFDFYDFDADGKISKEDIKTVLLYVSYTTENKQNDDDEYNKSKYEKKINTILDTCFLNRKLIDYIDFTNIVNTQNSDIYFMIYMFLLKKKPFSFKSLELYYSNLNKNLNENYNTRYISQRNFNLKFLNEKNIIHSSL